VVGAADAVASSLVFERTDPIILFRDSLTLTRLLVAELAVVSFSFGRIAESGFSFIPIQFFSTLSIPSSWANSAASFLVNMSRTQ
jgi:hypothetical protein